MSSQSVTPSREGPPSQGAASSQGVTASVALGAAAAAVPVAGGRYGCGAGVCGSEWLIVRR